jgi:hypothetical protein
MGAERLLMRHIREILRLKHEVGLHHRAIAKAGVILRPAESSQI